MQNNGKFEELYQAAKKADAAFHEAVVEQFGARFAGTDRYRTSLHNEKTLAARQAHIKAANELLDFKAANR